MERPRSKCTKGRSGRRLPSVCVKQRRVRTTLHSAGFWCRVQGSGPFLAGPVKTETQGMRLEEVCERASSRPGTRARSSLVADSRSFYFPPPGKSSSSQSQLYSPSPPSSKGSIEAEWNEDGLEGGQQQDPKDFPSIISLNPPNRGSNESPPFYR